MASLPLDNCRTVRDRGLIMTEGYELEDDHPYWHAFRNWIVGLGRVYAVELTPRSLTWRPQRASGCMPCLCTAGTSVWGRLYLQIRCKHPERGSLRPRSGLGHRTVHFKVDKYGQTNYLVQESCEMMPFAGLYNFCAVHWRNPRLLCMICT